MQKIKAYIVAGIHLAKHPTHSSVVCGLTLCTLPVPVSLGDSCLWAMTVELTLSIK